MGKLSAKSPVPLKPGSEGEKNAMGVSTPKTAWMSALVLGDRGKPEIGKVVGLLKPHFSRVDVLARSTKWTQGLGDPALLILTDTLPAEPMAPVVCKERFPEAGLFGLFRVIDTSTELKFRSAGTLFLGSYETFYAYSDAILASFFTGAGRNRQPAEQTNGGSNQ